LMAPRLIALSFAFLQPGGERRRRKASETGRDLARITEIARASGSKDPCHSSRVKGAVDTDCSRRRVKRSLRRKSPAPDLGDADGRPGQGVGEDRRRAHAGA
jgi:hypothetical protein